ncbi:MAG: L-2-hydroxyglutarate oxidase [Actinomycetota bacterium]|jgi:L-2-hydroxyglutarate oxidase|nr:L-2-hydroxyglutarate oxidase [Actinomycetota bacterium]MDQ3921120.1 L-2-hydroxyglutarate oxidase [Actinomycetota bacterium]
MFDFAIVGGGIVGLSTARALLERHPNAGVLVLEKEEGWARHQTGHNSGVIHSGVYYKPGSLKARFSRDGVAALLEFCREQRIAYEICGKVIVATDPDELPRLDDLYERGLKNGLKVEKIGPDELEELEPHAAGLAALKVPETGIVDFTQVAEAFAAVVAEEGGVLRTSTEVEDVSETEDEVEISTNRGTFRARSLVNCAGLHSDRVALLCGVEAGVKIVPFRGEYYELKPEKRHLVKNIVYPLPDPSFPFLNVHLTRTVEGGVEAGPNAVLGLAREGYRKTDINIKDSFEALTYPGLWRLARTYWRTGIGELVRSFSRKVFTRSLKKLIPEVEEEDLAPIEAGVRAQALAKDGELVNDFLIVDGKRSVHVLNAPSPAATAAIPIGKTIAERITERRRP